ncbi:MAG: hypothetical protein AABX02_00035, partial [archaeon]
MSPTKLEYGCPPATFRRDWMLYVAIQLVIFIKVVLFFIFFAKGVSYGGQPLAVDLPFVAMPVFGNLFHIWEYLFHQIMHVLIAFWVILLVKHTKKFDVKQTAKLFVIATILHNVGYWVTGSHPSWLYSLRDFATDYVALWGFFTLFW